MNWNSSKKLINSIYLPPKKNGHEFLLGNYYEGDFHKSYYSLARHALKAGLASLGLKKNDKVLLPSFICRDALAPFNELGIEILFYDLDKKLKLAIAPEQLPYANAIVAVHYFGLETDLTPYFEYCRIHQAFLIEDNAHGLFSKNSYGELLGTKGDIGVVSIRKTLPLQNGAMLLQALKYKKVDQVETHDYISKNLKIKNKLRPLVVTLGIGFLLKVTKLKRLTRKWKTGNEFPLSSETDELTVPFEENPIDIEKSASIIDFEAEIKRRRELFFLLREFLKDQPIKPLRTNLTLNEVPYTYPFYCESIKLEKIKNSLETKGLEVIKWPSLPNRILSNSATPEFYHSLYLVKFLW